MKQIVSFISKWSIGMYVLVCEDFWSYPQAHRTDFSTPIFPHLHVCAGEIFTYIIRTPIIPLSISQKSCTEVAIFWPRAIILMGSTFSLKTDLTLFTSWYHCKLCIFTVKIVAKYVRYKSAMPGKVIYTKYSKQFKWNSYFYVSGQIRPFWAALKLL